ncbi:polysaccharide biosynthesis/export family protein [Mucilaginibacter sp. SP1R1]|uniref:polysaccharide biosynthesis/export family protein n=1 Tax=Mucilaginibacter sp. SP1R1 TaxID=2723091 RepID=UPI0016094259|nr:polysaccharide biosynthesis/export family protein [Mucilaginibacter sp. SP1R1]MBB6152604.1 polysaccharide export outer membrane protein [Mucilaginibacter sp. SP1R1]
MRKNFILICLISLPLLILFSCSSTKKVKYFQDLADSGQLKTIAKAEYYEPKVQVDDILTIVVQTLDPSATQMINSGNIPIVGTAGATTSSMSLSPAATAASSQQQATSGYLVDKQGFVDIPVLGKVSVIGHTTFELKDILTTLASKYYQSPTVNVRFANFKISVTGEVLKPGVYIMPNEKVSILDALAMAGDLTIYGKRDNVLLIRENADGTKSPYRINLKKSNIMSTDYYYLRQNDIIYVEPGQGKAAATDASQARYYTLVGSLLSVIIVFLTRK